MGNHEGLNQALILIKSHASGSAEFRALVERTLVDQHGLRIVARGEVSGPELKAHGTVDAHYGVLAERATTLPPKDLAALVDDAARERFQVRFGLSMADAVTRGLLVTYAEAFKRHQREFPSDDEEAFAQAWRAQGAVVKLAPGTYVAQVGEAMVVNGFYGTMQRAFTAEGAITVYMVVEWEESKLPWKAFRADVIGATDPGQANPESIRGKCLAGWDTELHLATRPTTTQNGVHASASALEGAKEIGIWVNPETAAKCPLALRVHTRGIKCQEEYTRWLRNEKVTTASGQTGLAYDLCEDLDTDAIVALMIDDSPTKPSACCEKR